MQPARQLAQLRQAGPELGDHRAELVAGDVVRADPGLQQERSRDEPLLGAVVEVALDVAPGPVGGVDEPRPRRVHLAELRLGDLAAPQRLLGGPAGGDVEDRPVQPATAVAGVLRLPAFEDPPRPAVLPADPVLERERASRREGVGDVALDQLPVGRMDHARERPHAVVDEVARRVAGDRLDLVADPVHRPVRVVSAAVHGTGDVPHQRAQPRLARPPLRRPEPGRDAREQDLRLERDAEDVVRPRVDRRAHLVRGAERGADHDVRRRELGLRAEPPRQPRAFARIGEHDVRAMLRERARRIIGRRDVEDRQTGARQHSRRRPRVPVETHEQHRSRAAVPAGSSAGVELGHPLGSGQHSGGEDVARRGLVRPAARP